MQLSLPIPLGPRIPVLYVEMDGTGIPVVRKETEGRSGKQEGEPAHTREVKLGCVFAQTRVDEEGYPILRNCSRYDDLCRSDRELRRIRASSLRRSLAARLGAC